MARTLLPVSALLASVAILLLGNGLQGTLLPVRAQLEEFGSVNIGILGSSYFLGFAIGCFLAPHAVRRVGHIRAFTAMVAIASTVSLAHALIVIPSVWWVFRALTGFCFAGLYMIIESWLMERSTNETRGFVFSVYTIINLTVITAGQMLTAVDDPRGFPLFAIASILVSLAAVPISLSTAIAPQPPKTVRVRPVHLFRISPVGVLGSFSVGLANGAFWSLGPVFAQREEGDVTAVAIFMSLAVIAGAVGQYPLGRLSDKHDRRRIIVGACIAASIAGAALSASSLYWGPDYLILGLAAVFGAFAFPLYSLCAAHTNDHVEADGFVEAASGLLLVFSAGAVIGPVLASLAVQSYGVWSLFLYTAVVHFALAAYATYRTRTREAPSEEDRGTFQEAATMSQTVSTIDTTSETPTEEPPEAPAEEQETNENDPEPSQQN